MTAALDAVAAATAAVPRLYPIGSVPTTPDYPYGVYSAALGRGDGYTLDETHGPRWGLVTVQTFGRTADSALTLMEVAIDALLDVRLLIVGHDCTPLKGGLDRPAVNRDPDDNGVIGTSFPLTFTATKETP